MGNLSYDTTKAEIEELFSQVGELVDVFLPNDRETGRPRGFAFVQYAEQSMATAAIERFNGFELKGRQLRINDAEDRERRPHSPRPIGPMPDQFKTRPKGSRRNIRARKRAL